MSEPENFLERWSRRKRAAAEPAAPEQSEPPPRQQNENDAPSPDKSDAAPESQSFDLASLPSIDSIGANTDVSAFLRAGVPPELTRAALRRAWSSDPAIRDFVGLVENGWDFNDPDGVPGFGAISAGDVARLLAQAAGEVAPATAGSAAEPTQAGLSRGNPEQSSPLQSASSEPSPRLADVRPAQQPHIAAPNSADVQRSENDASQGDSGNTPSTV